MRNGSTEAGISLSGCIRVGLLKGRKSRFGMRAKQLHVTQASELLIALIAPLFVLRDCEVTQA